MERPSSTMNPYSPLRPLVLGLLLFAAGLATCPAQTTVSITPDSTFQTIDGFGGAVITFKEYPAEYHDPAFFDRVVQDLGVSIVRVPIMEHTEWTNDNANPDVFNWDGFFVANNGGRRGLRSTMELMQDFKEEGVERFMATPWSPPLFMKTNRSPVQGGHLRADMVDELAEYLAAYVIMAKKNWGIDLSTVSLQNELLFLEFYRSCIYHPELVREAVRAIQQKFDEENIDSDLVIPEDMMFPNRVRDYVLPTMRDPETKDFDGHFAVHAKAGPEGLAEWAEIAQGFGRKTWMTETSGHDQTWQGAFSMATEIHHHLAVGNFSAWVYWQLSGESGRYTIMLNGEKTPKYYASKHFYKHIRPGAKRVQVRSPNADVLASAYRHDVNGTLTAVLLNTGDSAATVQLDGPAASMPAQFDVYVSSPDHQFEDRGAIPGGGSVTIPAQGIVTLVGETPALATRDAPYTVEPAWTKEEDDGDTWGNFEARPPDTEWEWHRPAGWTSLHDAILNGEGSKIEDLLEQGADLNAATAKGWRPIHAAAAAFRGSEGHGSSNDEEETYSKYDIFRLILDANPELSVTTDNGWTPLHAAVANADTRYRQDESQEIRRVEDLIEAGVPLEARDETGRTALHWAAWQGYSHLRGIQEVEPDIVQTLLDAGAQATAVDSTGRTPLHYAASMGYEHIVQALVQAGAEPRRADHEGRTPLDLAAEKELSYTLYTLRNGTVPAPLKNQETSTVAEQQEGKYGEELLKAAWNGNAPKVRRLLKKGADIYYMDSDGLRAIDRARDNGHEKIVRMLKNAEEEREGQ